MRDTGMTRPRPAATRSTATAAARCTPVAAIALVAGLLLAACGPSPGEVPERAASGFAGLGAQAADFRSVERGRPLVFPADHGAHDGYRIEWWYVTANLQDEEGRDWGVQWTLFRSATRPGDAGTGWGSANLWMGHAGLTGPAGHQHAERLARGGIGQAGVRADPFDAWIDDWSLAAPGSRTDEPPAPAADPARDGLARLRMRASAEDFSYDLQLASDRPLVLHGDGGYSEKSGAGQASYYYSQPFYTVSGEVVREGQPVRVTGTAWLDREWSSQPLAAEQQGWDWFSLHLVNGDKLMLFQVRQVEGEPYRAGTWIRADGRTRALQPDEIDLQALAQTRQVHGRPVPTQWQVRVPIAGVDVVAEAIEPRAWMGGSFPYWEGPVRLARGAGRGYLEMTGY